METLELTSELKQAGHGEQGERLGFDLYPYTDDQNAAVQRYVRNWTSVGQVAERISERDLRTAQQEKDAAAAYEVVYGAIGR
jgi:xylose isomerase